VADVEHDQICFVVDRREEKYYGGKERVVPLCQAALLHLGSCWGVVVLRQRLQQQCARRTQNSCPGTVGTCVCFWCWEVLRCVVCWRASKAQLHKETSTLISWLRLNMLCSKFEQMLSLQQQYMPHAYNFWTLDHTSHAGQRSLLDKEGRANIPVYGT
jgi:hypothetical protein